MNQENITELVQQEKYDFETIFERLFYITK